MQSCRLEEIFEGQAKLLQKYHLIEVSNGFHDKVIFTPDLDNKYYQALLKDLAWRVTEELQGEAVAEIDRENCYLASELIDVLHFYVELLICSGLTYDRLLETHWKDIKGESSNTDFMGEYAYTQVLQYTNSPPFSNSWKFQIEHCIFNTMHSLAMAMHCLKNKPWKQTHVETDIQKYEEHLVEGFSLLFQTLLIAGLTEDDIYAKYFSKNKINQKRQEEKY